MKTFVKKRMSLELIDDDALEYAITISGGVFRDMARLIRSSADNAIGRGDEKIALIDVKQVESEIRNEYRRILETEDYKVLKEIHRNRKPMGSEIYAKLLYSQSILEYQNNENWYDVHPAIVPLIEGG